MVKATDLDTLAAALSWVPLPVMTSKVIQHRSIHTVTGNGSHFALLGMSHTQAVYVARKSKTKAEGCPTPFGISYIFR